MARVPHPSGVPNAYATEPPYESIVFPEATEDGHGVAITGMDLNDLQRQLVGRDTAIGNMVARDGDVRSGAQIVVTRDAAPATTVTVQLAAGTIYVRGNVRSVPARVITGVPGSGEVRVGVRMSTVIFTEEDDPDLVGPHPGTEAEGEPLGRRVINTWAWSLETSSEPGEYYNVYVLQNGTPIDQSSAELTGVKALVAEYDRGAHGNYIVGGCWVTALGRVDGKQQFTIGDGEANIQGWKRRRASAIPFEVDEEPDLELISSEPHTYGAATGQPTTITVNRPPIANLVSIVITKRRTVNVIRGAQAGGSDELPNSAIQAIESVTQGGTTYDPAHYTLAGDNISWAPAGSEPAANSTYSVTYRHFEEQTPVSVSDTAIVVSGGVNGQPVFVTYQSMIPRIDLICMDINGQPVRIKGESARINPVPPRTPTNLLRLATVRNTWLPPAPYRPVVQNDGTRSMTYDYLRRIETLVFKVADFFNRAEGERNILSREPVAKRGIFTDNFVDDFYRDQGASQTAAVIDGSLCLAIDAVDTHAVNNTWLTLPWTEQIVLRQDQRTSGMLINPYANFVQMPAGLTLEPPVDFFTTTQQVWTSPVTRAFQAPPGEEPSTITIVETLTEERRPAEFMREAVVVYTIEGFGAGERLASLTLGGRPVQLLTGSGSATEIEVGDVPPADANGRIIGRFRILPNTPAGTVAVIAAGQAGTRARAFFAGRGTVEIETLRRVTLVSRAGPTTNPTVPQPTNPPTNPLNPTLPDWVLLADNQQLDGGNGGGADPLAQTFALPGGFGRMIVGVNLWIHAIGARNKGIRVQLCTVENGIPTGEVMAEGFISMTSTTIQPGSMVQARFRTPVYCEANRQYAFVIMTDDALHAVKVSKLGDVYDLPGGRQARVTSQAYTNGVLLASADRRTWTPVQEADLAFQVVAANFTATTRTVNLWTGPLDRVSDVVVRSGIDIPEEAARVRFQLVRASGQVVTFAEGQQLEFGEYIGPTGNPETVTLRAVLTGNARISPVVFPGTLFMTGRIRESGTYITRVFPMGLDVIVRAVFQRRNPPGSTIVVHADAGDGNWQLLNFSSAEILGGGWGESVHTRLSHAAANGGRVRITLTGGPGARVFVARLRCYAV